MLLFQILQIWYFTDVIYNFSEILTNATFIFNIIPMMTDGIVPASWSIGIEMIFYFIFPVIIISAGTLIRSLLLLFVTIFAAVKYSINIRGLHEYPDSFLVHNFILYLPYFSFGVLGFFIYNKIFPFIKTLRARKLLAWVICLVSIMFIYFLYDNSTFYMYFWSKDLRTLWDLLWGLPFMILCIGLSIYPIMVLCNSLTVQLGKISFSLYLIHPHVIGFFYKGGLYHQVANLLPYSEALVFWVCAFFTVLTTVVFALFTYYLIELPGMSLGIKYANRHLAHGAEIISK